MTTFRLIGKVRLASRKSHAMQQEITTLFSCLAPTPLDRNKASSETVMLSKNVHNLDRIGISVRYLGVRLPNQA